MIGRDEVLYRFILVVGKVALGKSWHVGPGMIYTLALQLHRLELTRRLYL